MVLFDSARQELPNGGQFVKFDYFDSIGEILAAEVNLALPITFSTRFWLRRLSKRRPIKLIMLLIDRSRRELSKTPLIVLIGRLETSYGPLSVIELAWAGVFKKVVSGAAVALQIFSSTCDASKVDSWQTPDTL